jgi:hypothetical protein
VTLVERALGLIDNREAVVLTSAPVVGGLLGTVLANLMFDLDAVSRSTHDRYGASLWLGEFVATLGLVLVVFGSLRAGRSESVAFVVGGYIAAAHSQTPERGPGSCEHLTRESGGGRPHCFAIRNTTGPCGTNRRHRAAEPVDRERRDHHEENGCEPARHQPLRPRSSRPGPVERRIAA